MLEHIEIEGVRNLSGVSLEIAPGATLLFGANGSGKTSFLEAIHLLGVGRSFRTHHSRPVIQHEAALCRVVGKVQRGSHRHTLGIERDRNGGVRAKIGGEPTQSLSELANHLPLILLDTDGLGILSGPPEGRRRLLDAILFHVEPAFLASWRRYQQALRQRNTGLRHGILGTDDAWLKELAETGEKLTESRAQAATKLNESLLGLAPSLSEDLSDIVLSFRAGWDRKESLQASLERHRDSDRAQGFTQVGPHRADLRLASGGVSAAEVLSRGQLKLLMVAMRLAQGRMIEAASHAEPLYLVDDLAAELDARHCAAVCQALAGGRQVILTAVERSALERAWGGDALRLFHVEQGSITAS